ncbi:hypothetical protein FIBSPDRAFT_184328 [Athelia psychrophila]|uniref:Uncharacterized protein n=1 Tax=Athelia psychrophila TaxID=1759441 RepID=A0A166AFN4_9AGAM|nr:hypothetical protein FIBSPDRAFT_184328 [Fibularhizoctonia sp. CBS 109695]
MRVFEGGSPRRAHRSFPSSKSWRLQVGFRTLNKNHVIHLPLSLRLAHPPLAPRHTLAAHRQHDLLGAPCAPLLCTITVVHLLSLQDGCVIDAASVKGFCLDRNGIFMLDRVSTRKRVVVTTCIPLSPGAIIKDFKGSARIPARSTIPAIRAARRSGHCSRS